jgi:hypothetical protein
VRGGRAGDVPPGAREAGNEPVPDRIGGRDHDDWNRAGGVLRRAGHGGSTQGRNDLDLALDQLGRQRGELLKVPLDVVVFEGEVLTFYPAEVPQALAEGVEIAGAIRSV